MCGYVIAVTIQTDGSGLETDMWWASGGSGWINESGLSLVSGLGEVEGVRGLVRLG